MNRLTLFTICLLAGTTNFALSQDEPKTNALDALEMAAPDSPIVSKAKTPAALETAKGFHLFDGEWKLHSVSLNQDDRGLEAHSGSVRNGVITIDNQRFEHRVVESNQHNAMIKMGELGAADSQWHSCRVERLEHVFLLRVQVPQPASSARPLNVEAEPTVNGTKNETAEQVFEFWRIDPQRKSVVKELESLFFEVNTHRQSGTPDQLQAAREKLRRTTLHLKKLDAAPQIQSLTYQVLQARKAGNHDAANLLQQEISYLTDNANSEKSVTQQTLQNELNATKFKHNTLSERFGLQHPKAREAQDRMDFLQSLISEQKNADNNGPQPTTDSRTELQQTRRQLLLSYDKSETDAKQVAAKLRAMASNKTSSKDLLLKTKAQLEEAVKVTFSIQQNLQDVRLQLAERDLQQLRRKHDRRITLVDQIVERRVKQLQQDDSPSTATARNEDSKINQLTKTVGRLYPELKIQAHEIEGSVLLRGTASQQQVKEIVTISEQFFPVVISQLQPDVLVTAVVESQSILELFPDKIVAVAQVVNEIEPYRKISKWDVTNTRAITDETSPVTESDVAGQYLNQRLSRGQRITRDMLVEAPTTEQIIEAYFKEAINGREVFRKRGFPSRTFPQSSQSVLDIPYNYDPKRLHSELPEWTDTYVEAVVDRLTKTPKASWSDEEFHLLWSLEPLVFWGTAKAPYDLQALAELFETQLLPDPTTKEDAETPSDQRNRSLILGMAARLNIDLAASFFEQMRAETSEQCELLKTMCANKAEWKWINQEHVRLAGLMQESPMQTIAVLLHGNWPENNSVATNWLYALSTPEQYDASRSSPSEDCPPPVDPLLLVLTMNHLAGESAEIDERIAAFFEEPHPSYAFLSHLDDLLSSKLTYRDTALDALAEIYQKTSLQRLKTAIKKVAPSAPIRGI